MAHQHAGFRPLANYLIRTKLLWPEFLLPNYNSPVVSNGGNIFPVRAKSDTVYGRTMAGTYLTGQIKPFLNRIGLIFFWDVYAFLNLVNI